MPNASYPEHTSGRREFARTTVAFLAWAVLLAAVAVMLRVAGGQTAPAPYEADYLRMDEPAYHSTAMKRVVFDLASGDQTSPSLQSLRFIASFLRYPGLMALLGAYLLYFGIRRGVISFCVFLFLPPTFPYLARLDSWMDGVCFSLMALFCFCLSDKISAQRRAALFSICLMAGYFSGMAVDSKMTALLTLVPAAVLFLPGNPSARSVFFGIGVACGFGVSHPDWLMHPSKAIEHVQFWNSLNAGSPALSPTYAITALFSAVPFCVWCMAALGTVEFRKEKGSIGLAVLFLMPICFFTVYRTLPPDGIRHMYLALPFLAAWAARGFDRLNIISKIGIASLWIAEMTWRTFPAF